MERRRWVIQVTRYAGIACLLAMAITVWAQVATEPKSATEKSAKSAAKATQPADDVPSRTDNNTRRTAPADEGARPRAADERTASNSRENEGAHQGGGWLGVYLAESQEGNAGRGNAAQGNGVQITQIFPASPAARAGLQAGDVITQINTHKVSDPQSFVSVIESMPPGTKANFTVLRNNQPTQIAATLGQNHWMAGQNQDWGQRGQGYGQGSQGQGFHQGGLEYPIYAMELENDRRNAEQHQRIEQAIEELKQEIRQLREELKQKK